MKTLLAWKSQSTRWFWRNWPEIRDELMSACMGLCILMIGILMVAMLVEGMPLP